MDAELVNHDLDVGPSEVDSKGRGLDTILREVLKVMVGQNEHLAENQSLQAFLMLPEDVRVTNLVEITGKLLSFTTIIGSMSEGKSGLDAVVDDLDRLKSYADMTCEMKGLPFNSSMVDEEGWLRLQMLFQKWVAYYRAEYADQIQEVSMNDMLQRMVQMAEDVAAAAPLEVDVVVPDGEEKLHKSLDEYRTERQDQEQVEKQNLDVGPE